MRDILLENKEIVAIAPFIESQGLIGSSESLKGIYIFGVNPDLENKVSIVGKRIVEGSWSSIEEEKYGIKDYTVYRNFAKKVYKIRDNVLRNIQKLRERNNLIIGYGAPAKATTALNFFGISGEIESIVEDNKLKHGKFLPGMKIPIISKSKIKK